MRNNNIVNFKSMYILQINTKKGRNQKTFERRKHKRYRCEQYWLKKWVTDEFSKTNKMNRHDKVSSCLGIESDVKLDFISTYAKNPTHIIT